MNARVGLTSVTHTQHVQTLKALTNAPATLGFVVMVKSVEMSTNVKINHITAVPMELVRTLKVLIRVRAMTVSMVMVVYVLTSMSVAIEDIFVTLMPTVLTSLVLTAAPAEKATPEMDGIAKVGTGSTIEASFIFVLSFPLA